MTPFRGRVYDLGAPQMMVRVPEGQASPLEAATGADLWLDASAVTGRADSDPLQTWTDLSGAGNDASQATAGKRPLYRDGANGIGGRPAVQFAAASLHSLDVSTLAPAITGLNTPWTFWAVIKLADTAAIREVIACGNAGTANSFIQARVLTTQYGSAVRDDAAVATKSAAGGTPTTSPHVVFWTFDGTTGLVLVDGVQVATGNIALTGAMTINQVFVGAIKLAGAESTFMNGLIAECGHYPSAVSALQIQSLARYAGRKYGIAVP